MTQKKSVLIIGLRPELIDFSDPAYAAFPGLDAVKVQSALERDEAHLNSLGYDAKLCLTDFGATAQTVVRDALQAKPWDCVLVGAGVRTIEPNFLLFEQLLNVIHAHAQQAKLCFNTRPDDTAAAVQRWV